MKAIIGIKKLMTQLFKDDGDIIPVTIIDVNGVGVVASKSEDKDGYEAVVLGRGTKKNATKAEQGQYKHGGFVPQNAREVRGFDGEIKVGDVLKASLFEVDETVDVTGRSKGKGFQGVVKRYGFKGGSKTHGQSDRHRAPGSIGSGTTPGRVFKGKRMPGRMGGETKTVKNLKVVAVDDKNGLIAIKGAIPGSKGSVVMIKSTR
ncbi:MAG: 50S ribosomal protein L3 [Candidatus Dojkabacteria bacterium]